MAFVVEVPLQNLSGRHQERVWFSTNRRPSNFVTFGRRPSNCVTFGRRNLFSISATLHTPVQNVENDVPISIMVNSCKGKMGQAIIKAATDAGLHIVPVSFGSQRDAGKTVQVGGKYIQMHGPSDRESTLASVYKEYPNLIVLDFTVPNAVNENAELYCKTGVPFVMGTTGGDRDLLYKTVQDSNVYAIISPQMGKQVLGFLAALQIMSKQFPGTFNGYPVEKQQLGVVGVPDEDSYGHAFSNSNLTSDGKVSVEYKYEVHGRSIYVDGAIDATLFLSKMIQSKADKKIYDMIDVLRAGSMR